MSANTMQLVIHSSYFIAALLFIVGLQRMSSPVTARNGILWAGAGMVLATIVTFLYPGMSNFTLMIAAILSGSVIAWVSGKKVEMTDMPQMIALYNGMGGGAAAAIAAIELFGGKDHGLTLQYSLFWEDLLVQCHLAVVWLPLQNCKDSKIQRSGFLANNLSI